VSCKSWSRWQRWHLLSRIDAILLARPSDCPPGLARPGASTLRSMLTEVPGRYSPGVVFSSQRNTTSRCVVGTMMSFCPLEWQYWPAWATAASAASWLPKTAEPAPPPTPILYVPGATSRTWPTSDVVVAQPAKKTREDNIIGRVGRGYLPLR
jgi:hypothetical protein